MDLPGMRTPELTDRDRPNREFVFVQEKESGDLGRRFISSFRRLWRTRRVGRLPRKQKDDTGRSFHLAGVTKVCSQTAKITELSACEGALHAPVSSCMVGAQREREGFHVRVPANDETGSRLLSCKNCPIQGNASVKN